jgi:flavin reductase (DIM6/NTAB) family NADH-FMN oxidoreductase RutF
MGPRRTLLEGTSLDRIKLRQAMGRFATGVTVVTTRAPDGKAEGVTANSFTTVSLDPPLVLWSLARTSRSFEAFNTAPHFAVNVLALGQLDLSRHFASPRPDKLAGIVHEAGHGGCPVLTGTIAHFECARESTINGGDHVIFLGRVLRASFRDGEPLIFSAGNFHSAAALAEKATAEPSPTLRGEPARA